ncbi:MAG: hypothetical protein IJ379_00920 [Lachnospiraceae bacterium]|nr:hypothetical protein [Lachnospiraceae bacterium]
MKNCHLTNDKNINRDEVLKFLNTHRDEPFSAAKFEYTLYLEPKTEKIANIIAKKHLTEEDILLEKVITEANTPEELLKLMRKGMSGFNRSLLREKLIENEDALVPFVQERCMRNKQDIFIENALYLFLHSKTNYCDWIVDNYADFQSEYLRSMFCLVLGFRGEVELIPFLMNEATRFEKEYPNEHYDQGPALAVQELAARFFK